VIAQLQRLGRRVVAVQHVLVEVDPVNDGDPVHNSQPVSQVAREVAAVHAYPGRQILRGGVKLVQIVLPLIEVVAHFFVRHRDGPGPGARPAAVGKPVLGRRGQLRGGEPVALVQVHHRPRDGGMRADQVGDLRRIHLDAEVVIHRDFAQLGDQTSVVLGGEERRVDAEHLGDSQQHRHRERPYVVLDLVQITRRDLQQLRQRGLAETALAAQLPHPRADERFCHVSQGNNDAKGLFALLAI
jgi:hypothetical protein